MVAEAALPTCRPINWRPVALVILLILVAIAVATAAHAVVRHGDEALTIRRCLDQKGPQMVYRQRDGSFLLFCQLPDSRWGMQIVDKAKEVPHNWIERTSFVKGDGCWNTVRTWLDRIGATRWTKPLP